MKKMTSKLIAGLIALAGIFSLAFISACNPDVPETPEGTKYSISIGTFTGGSVEADKTLAEEGETVTLTITTLPNYALDSFSIKTGETPVSFSASENTRSFTMPPGNVNVTAAFISTLGQPYTITINQYPHGTISTSAANNQAYANATITVTLAPEEDYVYQPDSLMINSSDNEEVNYDPAGDTGLQFEFTMPPKDITITAMFMTEGASLFDIIADTFTGGSISVAERAADGNPVIVTLLVNPTHRYIDGSIKVYKTGDENTEVDGLELTGALEWTFTMPDYDVTVTAELQEIPMYTVSVDDTDVENGTLTVSTTGTVSGKYPAGTDVTVTLTIDDTVNYERKGDIAVTIDNDTLPTTPGTAENGVYTWTFTMPAEEADGTVTVSATVGEIPAHGVSIALRLDPPGANGSLTVTPKVGDTNTARQGWTVAVVLTIDDSENYRYKPNSLKVVKFEDEDTTVTVTPDPQNALRWTFIMPEYAVIGEVTIEPIPFHTIGKEAPSNGDFDWTIKTAGGASTSFARENYTVTITTAPDNGFAAQLPVVKKSGDVSVAVNTISKNNYTFTMPGDDVTISVEFLPSGALKIYSDGVWQTGGVDIGQLVVEPNYMQDYANFVTFNSELEPGEIRAGSGHTKAIRVSMPGTTARRDVGFSISSAAPIDLSGTSGLSFWVYSPGEVNNSWFPLKYVGFGDHGTPNAKAMIWMGSNNNANHNLQQGWTRIIIPVPKIQASLSMNTVFSFKTTIGGIFVEGVPTYTNTEYLLIDDIEFLSGESVALDSIAIPASAPNMEVDSSRNAIDMVSPITFIYKSTAASEISPAIETRVSSRPIDNVPMNDYPLWGLAGDYTFAVSNSNASISGSGTSSVITAAVAGQTFGVTLQVGGKTSNTMTVSIPADNVKILEDYESNPPLQNGEQGYWRLFGWSGVEYNDGVAQEGYRWASYKFKVRAADGGGFEGDTSWWDQAVTLKAGRNFASPQNLSGFQTISFWINPNLNNPGVRALETETFSFTLYNNTVIGQVSAPSKNYYDAYVATGSPYTKTFTMANRGSTATTVKGGATWLEVRIPIAELLPAGLQLNEITGWSIGIDTIATATDTGVEYVVAIDNLVAER